MRYSSQLTEEERRGFNVAIYTLMGMGVATLLAVGGLAYMSNNFRQEMSRNLWPTSSNIETKLNSENLNNSSSNVNPMMMQLLLQTN